MPEKDAVCWLFAQGFRHTLEFAAEFEFCVVAQIRLQIGVQLHLKTVCGCHTREHVYEALFKFGSGFTRFNTSRAALTIRVINSASTLSS